MEDFNTTILRGIFDKPPKCSDPNATVEFCRCRYDCRFYCTLKLHGKCINCSYDVCIKELQNAVTILIEPKQDWRPFEKLTGIDGCFTLGTRPLFELLQGTSLYQILADIVVGYAMPKIMCFGLCTCHHKTKTDRVCHDTQYFFHLYGRPELLFCVCCINRFCKPIFKRKWLKDDFHKGYVSMYDLFDQYVESKTRMIKNENTDD